MENRENKSHYCARGCRKKNAYHLIGILIADWLFLSYSSFLSFKTLAIFTIDDRASYKEKIIEWL